MSEWILISERNPPKSGYYAVRYRSRLNKNAVVLTARYRKGRWDMFSTNFKSENFFAWCELPDASNILSAHKLKTKEKLP